jgi:ubiquinone/menaquinone biosynthesis C-methylase UbiE
VRLDNPLVVQWEYASEERLEKRNRAYRDLTVGDNAEELAFEAVREVSPRRVLEVGCGMGEFAERVARELGAEVVALDISARMVDLAVARGVNAVVGDVQELLYGDAEFDCAVANWVLYHVPDLDRAVSELARVLRPGGRLVAATLGTNNLADLWEALGAEPTGHLSFTDTNGAEALARYFARVERRDAHATMVFPDTERLQTFVAATIGHAHLSSAVPSLPTPFSARTRHCVFVAEKAA